MVNVMSLLAKAGSGPRFSFGVKAWIEMEIQCVKGMHRLKLVSSENNSVFKGLRLYGKYTSPLLIQPAKSCGGFGFGREPK